MLAKPGKFIVIDGIDGSGKETQTKLLVQAFKKEGLKVKVISFPEYTSNFFGEFIGHCLSEQYYNFIKVHPKIASVLYAADRFEAKNKIEKWLQQGFLVIANRYVSANQIHQGGKIINPKRREAFINWLDKMEYSVFKIPKPDIVFCLNVSVSVALKLIQERDKNSNRAYLLKKKDVHEKDISFLKNSYKSAQWLARHQKNWITIDCLKKDGTIDTRENIHQKIYTKIKRIIEK